ncbi:MAG: hypothetical protein K8L91_04055 [Anaerolineae bacterium]|nr:hypothetical protein [Anaerolineae bacterium]
MQRVVWIAALIMGLLLIGLTTGMLLQRRGSSSPEVVVASVPNARQTSYRLGLALHHDGREIWQKMGAESAGMTSLGPSPDGQWLYFWAFYRAADGYNLTTQRIRLDGFDIEALPALNPISGVFWSPDGQWLIYRGRDRQNGQEQLFRASPDGKTIQNLTPDFPHTLQVDYPLPPIIGPENEWIVFNAFDGSNHVYRVDIASSEITELADGASPIYALAHFRNQTGDWLLVTGPGGAYRTPLEGGSLTRLLPNEEVVFSNNMVMWDEARLILLYTEAPDVTLYAVSMDDYSLRWSLPQIALTRAPVGRTHVLGFGAEGAVYAIDAQGHTKQVAPLFANMPTYQWSPDERWLVYTMGGHLYAVTMPDGAERDLYSGSNQLAVLEWADDGESVVIMEDAGTGISLWRVGLADGHKQPMMAYREGVQYLGMGRLRGWTVDGFGLLDIGCILTAVSAVRLARRRK